MTHDEILMRIGKACCRAVLFDECQCAKKQRPLTEWCQAIVLQSEAALEQVRRMIEEGTNLKGG